MIKYWRLVLYNQKAFIIYRYSNESRLLHFWSNFYLYHSEYEFISCLIKNYNAITFTKAAARVIESVTLMPIKDIQSLEIFYAQKYSTEIRERRQVFLYQMELTTDDNMLEIWNR